MVFVDKPMDQYWAGPFKVSNWNSSEKVITLAPNDKWWGEKKPFAGKDYLASDGYRLSSGCV